MAEHTPGPWEVKHETNVVSSEGRTIANAATLFSNGPDWERVSDENKANAKLMAASPDLLSACEFALGLIWNDYLTDEQNKSNQNVLRAAIAKAKIK